MAKLQIDVDENVEYVPKRKVRKFSNKQRIKWPFTKMKSGDSFVIPENYTLGRVSGAFSRFKMGKPDWINWGLRSQELDDGTVRVWIFSPEDLEKFPTVD